MPRQYRQENPGRSYYDMLYEQLMMGSRGVEDMEGGYQMMGMQADLEGRGWSPSRAAKNVAGQSEDALLSGLLGSKRKLGEDEDLPQGAYALSPYPGLRQATDWAATGNAPAGGGQGSGHGWLREQNDSEYGDYMRQGRRDWAANQKALMGWSY